MLTVKFNSVEEFIQELTRDAGKVDRGIVRITNLFTRSTLSPNISHVTVIATAQVAGDIIRLDRYCGQVWGLNTASDKKIIRHAEAIQERLRQELCPLGLEMRAGVLEAEPGEPVKA